MIDTPIVRNGFLHSDNCPVSLSLLDAREEWRQWLEEHRKVRFDFGDYGDNYGKNFTAFKDRNHYWTAQKRVDGKLRQKRLGTSSTFSKMSLESLYEIACQLTDSHYELHKQEANSNYLKSRVKKLEDEIEQLKESNYVLRKALDEESQERKKYQSYSMTNSEAIKESPIYQDVLADIKALIEEKREFNKRIKHLETIIADYEASLGSLKGVIDRYSQNASNTRNWVEAKRLLSQLDAVLPR